MTGGSYASYAPFFTSGSASYAETLAVAAPAGGASGSLGPGAACFAVDAPITFFNWSDMKYGLSCTGNQQGMAGYACTHEDR